MVAIGRSAIPILFLAVMVLSSPRQQEVAPLQEPASLVDVRLANAAGFPGKELTIPVYLDLNEALPVGAFAFELLYSTEMLTFKESATGFLLKEMDRLLEAQMLTGESGRLQISVAQGVDPIPGSLLGYLVFSVNPEAPLGRLELSTQNLVVRGVEGNEILPASVALHRLLLIDPSSAPIFGCFFYMH